MAKCPHCDNRSGFRVEEIMTTGTSRNSFSVLCCNGCDAVIHVFEPRSQFYYGNGINEIIKELKDISAKLHKD